MERAAREHKGWTLAQFADQLGVSYETVRKWVVGTTAPNRNRIKRICELLPVSPEWVMFGEGAAVAAPALAPEVSSSSVMWSLTPDEAKVVEAYRASRLAAMRLRELTEVAPALPSEPGNVHPLPSVQEAGNTGGLRMTAAQKERTRTASAESKTHKKEQR